MKIIEKKKKLKKEVMNEINELKKLEENQIKSMEKDIINDFENIKRKKEKYDEIINILKEDFQNKWIPAPLYSEKKEQINLENIKEDIPENTLRIEFKKTDYIKSKPLFITAGLKGTNYKEEWGQKSPGDWSHITDFQLKEEEYKNISKKVFFFNVKEKIKNKEKLKGEGEIKLEKLEENNEYSNNFEFNLKTKKLKPHVLIDFKVRKCAKPKYTTFEKREFFFTKFYPAFKNE